MIFSLIKRINKTHGQINSITSKNQAKRTVESNTRPLEARATIKSPANDAHKIQPINLKQKSILAAIGLFVVEFAVVFVIDDI